MTSKMISNTKTADLFDDSAASDSDEIYNSTITRHLFELSAFDVIVGFLVMSLFLAFFSRFRSNPILCFLFNLVAVVLVRVVESRAARNFIVCCCVIVYCGLVASQNRSLGYTFNYFWTIPFIFILTGFRIVVLFRLVGFVALGHLFFIGIEAKAYAPGTHKGVAAAVDSFLFCVNLISGIAIYTTFFILHQTVWRLRRHPGESICSIANIRALELRAFSQLPMGLLLSRGALMSAEQHLFILLRLAQHTEFRDVLLQLMRPTANEIELEYAKAYTKDSESKRSFSLSSAALQELTAARQLTQTGINSFHQYSALGANIPVLGEERDADFQDIRQFLRSALTQFFLETHPNRGLCDKLLNLRPFHCTRQQIEAALVSFAAHKRRCEEQGTASPRICINNYSVRLWSSSDRKQRRFLPLAYHDFLIPKPGTRFNVTFAGKSKLGQFSQKARRATTVVSGPNGPFLAAANGTDIFSDHGPAGPSRILSGTGTRRFDTENGVGGLETRRRRITHYSFTEGLPEPFVAQRTEKGLGEPVPALSRRRSVTVAPLPHTGSLAISIQHGKSTAPHVAFPAVDRKSFIFSQKEPNVQNELFRRLSDTSVNATAHHVRAPSLRVAASLAAAEGNETSSARLSVQTLVDVARSSTSRRFRLPSLARAVLGLNARSLKFVSKDTIRFPHGAQTIGYRKLSSLLKEENAATSQGALLQSPEIRKRLLDAAKPNKPGLNPLLQPRTNEKQKKKYVSCCKKNENNRVRREMTRLQVVQHSLHTFNRFCLTAPSPSQGYLPARKLNGTFQDTKIERWYLAWASYIESFIIVKLRRTYAVIVMIQILIPLFATVLYCFITAELSAPTQTLQILVSAASVSLHLIILVYCLFHNSPWKFGEHSTCHLFKLRSGFLATTGVILSMMNYFLDSREFMETSIKLSMIARTVLLATFSLQEACSFISFIMFPLFCLCTEATMGYLIFPAVLTQFFIGPLLGVFANAWPITIKTEADDSLGNTDILRNFSFGRLPPSSLGTGDIWQHYFELFPLFAPCFVLQYVLARTLHGTLRRLFSRTVLLYLMYLDAMGAPFSTEDSSSEDDDSETMDDSEDPQHYNLSFDEPPPPSA